VEATGNDGRVTREDVERFHEVGARPAGPATKALAPRTAPRQDETIPLRGMRGRIAEQMVRSQRFAPHFTYVDECDMTEVARLREAAKPLAAEQGVRLTWLPFIIKALAACLRRHPVVNAIVDEENDAYVMRGEIHVGLATDTEAGLMVPVIHDADRRSILDLAAEIQRLTGLARSRRIALEDLKGGTISITSAGSIGGILATPILNHPEVAILGVYRIQDRPVVRDGEIVVRKMTNLSITLDHRIVDGATAARFMNDLIRFLETPGLLLLEAPA
jgi:pyruvate dehydrogenase E2 component (dihydrolipoamide acetyltransferase)